MLRPIRLSLAESSRTLLAIRLSLAESSRTLLASREKLSVILREGRPKDPLLVATVGVADPSQAQDDTYAKTGGNHLGSIRLSHGQRERFSLFALAALLA